jgi:hypothetical protein
MAAARFFGLLILVSAVPFVFLPISAELFPGVATLEGGTSVLLLLGSQAHVAASFFFYAEPRSRGFMLRQQPARFVWVPIAIVLFSAAFFYLASSAALRYAVIGFWIWQTHHYTRQNHGILAFARAGSGVKPSLAERTAVTLSGVAGVIGMIRFVTPWEPTFLGAWGWQLHTTAAAVFACAWAAYLVSLRDAEARSSPLRMALVLVLMLFYLPLFLFTDPISAVFSYAVAHGLQYLLFMYVVASTPRQRRQTALATLVTLAVVGGLALKSTEMTGPLFGPYNAAVFGLSLGVVMWHFVLDAGIWRLSQPFQRAYMAERFSFLG